MATLSSLERPISEGPAESPATLRRIEEEDAERVFGILIANKASSATPIEVLSFGGFLETVFRTSMFFALADRDDEMVALISLGNFDHHARKAEFGVISMQRRKGYAAEAVFAVMKFGFLTLGLNRLYCVVNADNYECLKLIEKFKGVLTPEARLRQSRFKDGLFVDQFLFGILAVDRDKWDRPSRGPAPQAA